MVVIAGRTREQLRTSVGYALGGVKLLTATAGGGTTTFLTDDLFGAADDHNGKSLQFTGPSNNDGSTRRVTDSSVTDDRTTLTFYPSGTTPAASDTAELWDEQFPPARIHDLMNRAIMEAQGRVYDLEESVALHADGREIRFDIPTQFAMLSAVHYRQQVESRIIHLATTAWVAGTNVTASQDTRDYKRGPGSAKLVVAAGVAAGAIIATKDITSIDLSGYDTVEFWIKSTVTVAANDLQILLDDTAASVSAIESINIPALVANTWTFVRVTLATPELDTAIISVGIKYVTDLGACTIWVNDIRAVLNDTATWVTLDKNGWRVDSMNRDLILTAGGRSAMGYSLMKLVGGDKPLLLTSDSDVCEIDEEFVLTRTCELALLASSGGPQTDPDAHRQLAGYWGQRAQIALRGMPFLVGVREIG